jgi:hypothetical protein
MIRANHEAFHYELFSSLLLLVVFIILLGGLFSNFLILFF